MKNSKIEEKILDQKKKTQLKPKKRENIPYLIEKIEKKNIITGLIRVIGTRFLHNKDINKSLGIPEHKSSRIKNLSYTQKKNYVYNLNQYNFLYEYKDAEEIDSRSTLLNMKPMPYKQWRYAHGLPCRGQRTKTNASTAYYRTHSRVTYNKIKKDLSKSNKKFNILSEKIAKENKI